MSKLRMVTTQADIERYLLLVGLPPTMNQMQLKKIDWKALVEMWRRALHVDRYVGLSASQREALHGRWTDVADAAQQLYEWSQGLWTTREQDQRVSERRFKKEKAKARAVDEPGRSARMKAEQRATAQRREELFRAQRERARVAAERQDREYQERLQRQRAGMSLFAGFSALMTH